MVVINMKKPVAKSKNERFIDPVKESEGFFTKLSNLQESLKMGTRDPIHFLYEVSVAAYDTKIARLTFKLIFIQFTIGTTMALHKLVSSFNKDVFFKYGPFAGCQIFILINIGTIILKFDEALVLLRTIQNILFPIGGAGEQCEREIRRISLYLKIICVTNLTCACIAAGAFSFSTDYLYGKTYVILFVKEHFPNYSKYFNIWISFTIWPCAFLMVSLSHALGYIGFNALFQIKLLNVLIKNICATNLKEEIRYDSEVYQKILTQKLKIITMVHQILVRMIYLGQNIIYMPIIALTLGAVILGGSLMLDIAYTFSLKGEATQNYIGLFFCSVAGVITTLLYVFTGQLFKDESEETYNRLTQLPWYYMNVENRKLYLFMLMNTKEPVSLTTDLMELNFLLALRIAKGLYSMLCLIINFM